MKKIFLALTLFANILFANANPITEEQALKIASKYSLHIICLQILTIRNSSSYQAKTG